MEALRLQFPDHLSFKAQLVPAVSSPAASLRFLPTQFAEEGMVFQHILARQANLREQSPPSIDLWSHADFPTPELTLTTEHGSPVRHLATEKERVAGIQRFFMPVFRLDDLPVPLRTTEKDDRVEPRLEQVCSLPVHVKVSNADLLLEMPVYEPLGRNAPCRAYDMMRLPDYDSVKQKLPMPILSVAEWAMASITGDRERLRHVYPLLVDYHRWLENNRQLPDGTYWTTGLANGLDNSPSLGDGYPCLTAQMAHDAETLGKIAEAIGESDDAAHWREQVQMIKEALNTHLWDEEAGFYLTTLPDGGFNPNKVVTGFWPLWAGIVPEERVERLAGHLKDPASFWRHHPIPSLAADSPHFVPEGQYWLGSAWAPTNFAVIKGFDRAGRHELAEEAAIRHLQCMWEIFRETGFIWENYSSESSRRGSWSMKDYSWSALGPIALLIEVVLGIQVDAMRETIVWSPPKNRRCGIDALPVGKATASILQLAERGKWYMEVRTDHPVWVEIRRNGASKTVRCETGFSRFEQPNPQINMSHVDAT
jgi:hypothetical protein